MAFKIKNINLEIDHNVRKMESPLDSLMIARNRTIGVTINLVAVEGDRTLEGVITALHELNINNQLVDFDVSKGEDDTTVTLKGQPEQDA